MSVSLSLIRLDTVLRLERQQMATHATHESNASMLHDCEVALPALDQSQPVSHTEYVLVALSLKRIVRRNETKALYYNKYHVGER